MKFEITSPSGKVLEIEGDALPSEAELDEIFKLVDSGNVEPTSNKKGLDLTPSGLYKQAISYPFAGIGSLISGKPFEEVRQAGLENLEKTKPLGGVGDFIFDMGVYSRLPMARGFKGANALNGLYQGGLIGGLEGLKEGQNPIQTGTQGALLGGAINSAMPIVKGVGALAGKIPGVSNLVNFGKRVGSSALNGALESFAMGKDAVGRMLESARGSDLSRKANYYGSDEFMNDIANRFKNGVDDLRSQEVKSFAEARDNLLANNQDTKVDLNEFIGDVFNKLQEKGFIDEAGNLTPVGNRANGIKELINDLNYYRGQFDLTDLQRLKSNVLDDVINYKPDIGQTLNNSTSDLQNITRDARRNVNDILNQHLGEEYGAINNKLSSVLNIMDNNPELKNLTNSESIDTLANKLKKVGTTRQQAQQEINKLEGIMNDNGINISENGLVNDILDYNAARDINQRIRTGQDANFRNIPRRALVQPLTEFYVDRVIPFGQGAKQFVNNVSPKVKQLLTIGGAKSVPMLYGGISNDDMPY